MTIRFSSNFSPIYAAVLLLGCVPLAQSGANIADIAKQSAAGMPATAPAKADATALNTDSAKAKLAQLRTIEDQEPAVTAQLREVLQKMAVGSIGQEYFTERAIASLFPAQVKTFGDMLRGIGALTGVELLSRTVDGENRVYRYRVLGQNGKLLMDVVYGKSSRINQFALTRE